MVESGEKEFGPLSGHRSLSNRFTLEILAFADLSFQSPKCLANLFQPPLKNRCRLLLTPFTFYRSLIRSGTRTDSS